MQHYFFNKVKADQIGTKRQKENLKAMKSYHFLLTGEGVIGAQVKVSYSNINTHFFEYQTFVLDGSDSPGAVQLFHMHGDIWHYVEIEILDIVGTNAELTVVVGTEP